MSEARRITVTGAMQLAGALAQATRDLLTIESIEATGRNQWVVQVSPGVAVPVEKQTISLAQTGEQGPKRRVSHA